jgi:DNA-binding response OmpR family regulator
MNAISRGRFMAIMPLVIRIPGLDLRAQPPLELRPSCARRRRPEPFIYVVDDTKELTELYRLALEEAGYGVRTFNDRMEALRAFLADNVRPNVLITDYRGYPISAEHLMNICRKVQPDLKILMASACLEGSLSFSGVRPDRYLEKPFTIEQFLAEVRALAGCPSREGPNN